LSGGGVGSNIHAILDRWVRRLVREALPKIAVENGGPNLNQKRRAERSINSGGA
jgi:hypothetical protein